MLCLPHYAFVFSSTKLEIRAEQFFLEMRGGGGRERGWWKGGRNDPNNVHMCE
jgi:hypothetical protein